MPRTYSSITTSLTWHQVAIACYMGIPTWIQTMTKGVEDLCAIHYTIGMHKQINQLYSTITGLF